MFVYLNDIVIYAVTLKEHRYKFGKLMQGFKKANLKLQPDKYQFLCKKINYLGHVISD